MNIDTQLIKARKEASKLIKAFITKKISYRELYEKWPRIEDISLSLTLHAVGDCDTDEIGGKWHFEDVEYEKIMLKEIKAVISLLEKGEPLTERQIAFYTPIPIKMPFELADGINSRPLADKALSEKDEQ